jgi:hypothetical protein
MPYSHYGEKKEQELNHFIQLKDISVKRAYRNS